MDYTYTKKYRVGPSRFSKGFILVDTHQRNSAIITAMDHWARIAPSEKEEYLFRDGFLRVDNTHLNNNDVEVHSTTDAGLKKLIDLLGLPPE